MASKFLLRTNTALTTNVRLVVNTKHNCYLESYNSNNILSNVKYKHIPLSENNYLTEAIPFFYKGVPSSIAFSVKNNQETIEYPTDKYSEQYDSTYLSGANVIEDNWHEEEFEYNTTLKIDKDNLPSAFIILRIDGAGIYNLQANESLNIKGFRPEIIDKWKIVQFVDMKPTNPFGKLLKKNYTDAINFPSNSFELNLNEYQFSKWNGIEYNSGGFCSKSLFLNNIFSKQLTHYELEEFITDGFKNNNVIIPNMLNVKFLFNDTVGEIKENRQTSRKEWSINRYVGFYLDEVNVLDEVSPFEVDTLKPGVDITNNIFSEQPFIKGYIDNQTQYVKYNNKFLEVIKSNNNYIVIDNILHNSSDITTYFNIQDKVIIRTVGTTSILEYSNGSKYVIPHYNEYDLIYIVINNNYHVLKTDVNGNVFIQSDSSFITDNNNLYESKCGIEIEPLSFYNDEIKYPNTFKIYSCKFTEICDFDFERLNTSYNKFEYEKYSEISTTEEQKSYVLDRRNNSEEYYSEKDYTVNNNITPLFIPSSSEYASDESLWEVINDKFLNKLWDKNQSICKWGYNESISHCDYPYKLNNSLIVGGAYNKTTSINSNVPNRLLSNLDWFYTIGMPKYTPQNISAIYPVSDVRRYVDVDLDYCSLNIDINLPYYNQDVALPSTRSFWTDSYFDLDTYLDVNTPYDYFEYFFTHYSILNDKKYSTKKYSSFQKKDIDNIITTQTLFRGLNFEIVNTNPIDINNTTDLNLYNNGEYEDYKFSAILTKRPTNDTAVYGKSGINIYVNKIYKNILVYIYVFVPHNSLTNIEFIQRDDLYNANNVVYDLNVVQDNSNVYLSKLVDTNLNINKLTAYNFVSILNNSNYNNDFDYEMNYEIIENIVKYKILSVAKNNTNSTLNLLIDKPHNFKIGEYIYLERCTIDNPSATVLDGNYKIVEIDNNLISIVVNNISTATFISSSIGGNIFKAISQIPFKLGVKLPNDINCYTDTYNIKFDTNKTLNTLNNIKNISNVNINDDLVPSVYNEQPLFRVFSKNSTNSTTSIIHRYSGNYEPILKTIPLFSKLNLSITPCNIDSHSSTNNFYADGSKFKIAFTSITGKLELNIGDYLFVTVSDATFTTADALLQNKVYTITEVDYVNNIVTLNRPNDIASTIDVDGVYVYKCLKISERCKFDTTLYKFGMMNQHITKVFADNFTLKSLALNIPPIYPMIDECAISEIEQFIFKSSWDDEYYYKYRQNKF